MSQLVLWRMYDGAIAAHCGGVIFYGVEGHMSLTWVHGRKGTPTDYLVRIEHYHIC